MSSLLNCLLHKEKNLPIWFMRQAGRYLPEYQKIRKNNKDFIKFCLNINDAAKVSIQPIKRFDLDAIIVFSDILLILNAAGQKIEFKENIGPVLNKYNTIILVIRSCAGLVLHSFFVYAENLAESLTTS